MAAYIAFVSCYCKLAICWSLLDLKRDITGDNHQLKILQTIEAFCYWYDMLTDRRLNLKLLFLSNSEKL
jgi:hypothetical protein